MKALFALSFSFLFVAFPDAVSAEPDWELVWADEFDYTGPPDPEKWDYERGFVRNEEAQYYTDARSDNARVENGMLVIEGRREPVVNAAYNPELEHWQALRPMAGYTSASVITKGKMQWKYGRLEVRAKVPSGKGVWPAIWMLGINREKVGWPRCGEIDIMEFLGRKPDGIYGTAIYSLNGEYQKSRARHIDTSVADDFHLYAMEWFPDRIDFFFNDERYHTFVIDEAGEGADNPFRKPFYLLINLALGGNWGEEIDDSQAPWLYQIDYVRWYKQVEANTSAHQNGISATQSSSETRDGVE